MPKRDFNLRVIKLEYNIPQICFDIPEKSDSTSSRHLSNVNSNYSLPIKKYTPVPEVNIVKLPRPSLSILVEELLREIYGRRRYSESPYLSQDPLESETSVSVASLHNYEEDDLKRYETQDLRRIIKNLERRCQQVGSLLGRKLCTKDLLKRRRNRLNSAITVYLQKIQYEQGDDGDMRFSTTPRGGASGWAEWLKAMKLVAHLPTGVPPEFRKKLWLTLAEQHLKVKGVDWSKAEKTCFNEWTNPDDTELGVQIVKDLHRTGCSLFCGSEGRENQAVLKRVLLAYARWNKGVGYCQGFNMLAALILEVMDRSESDSLKVMIYLIEAVLPEGYFANNLRGLSVDMAVFRDLLKLRLPKLSAHLDKLQKGAAEGSVYEPPLTNVFTMQWFLTLFCNCLPHDTVLRVWDLAFLEGDAVLLTTALAIWENLQERILKVESADEFYSVMGELARETLEASPSKGEQLIVSAAKFGPIPELPKLRDKHRYNITPWAQSVQSAAKKGLRLFYSEDEVDSSDEGDKLAITTAYGLQGGNSNRGKSALVAAGVFGHPDREKLALDISALKQQYERLRERQRQAHIILAAACARQSHVGGGPGPMSMNHLLLGKSAIVSNRGRRLGPPQGAIPPSRSSKSSSKTSNKTPTETLTWTEENQKKKTNRRDSIKWRDIKQASIQSDEYTTDPEEIGQQMSDTEVNEIMQTSMRSRRRSESSSYSECSESSTSTSLCDEANRMSDFDSEPASASDNIPFLQDDIFESNASREGTENDEIKSDIESSAYKGDKEFGAYIQEFEELLDRTNSLDVDRGLICVLPDNECEITDNTVGNISEIPKSDSKYDNKDINYNNNNEDGHLATKEDDTKPTKFEYFENSEKEKTSCKDDVKIVKTEAKGSVIASTVDVPNTKHLVLDISPEQDAIINKCVQKESGIVDDEGIQKSPIPEEKECKFENNPMKTESILSFDQKQLILDTTTRPSNSEKLLEEINDSKTKFIDYMDSIRVEQLKSYLNEFKRPELYTKTDTLFHCDMDKSDVFREVQNASAIDETLINDDQEVASICDETRNIDKEDTATIRTLSSIEYRSTSGDRSISSSLSSFSPILRSTPGVIEDIPSFVSYKSPSRDTDLPSEIDEDEKPIVLKIDKYFEHSPEFFGARKSSHFFGSSDDEDGRHTTKRKISSHKSIYMSPIKTDSHKLFLCDLKNDKSHTEEKKEPFVSEPNRKSIHEDFITGLEEKRIPIFSPISSSGKSFPILKSPDTFKHKRISSLDSPLSVKYLTKPESAEFVFLEDDSPNTPRGNVLEKTKSEDLPRIQTKSFSVLDEEIDDIRSGRRNSERALRIIQENSNILHSILVNQVNKCHTRETVPEESYIESVEDMNESFALPDIPYIKNRNVKILMSPRSTSFDDRLLKLNTSRSDKLEFTEDFVKKTCNFKSPTEFKETVKTNIKDFSERKSITQRPKSFESHIFLDDSQTEDYKSMYRKKEISTNEDNENKTDKFGWENKGFEAKQRLLYKDENFSKPETALNKIETPKVPFTHDYRFSQDVDSKNPPPKSIHRLSEDINTTESTKITKLKYDAENSPVVEKQSSLTSVSEILLDTIDYKSRDNNETSLIESNLSMSELNISTPYRYSYKSNDHSSNANSSYKNLRANDLHPITENYSNITENSPVDNNYSKPDVLKFDTSHSSDLCIISSSMSFSFDPSVEDHTSSKPGTFNSSDTLCQLTSLDQVSTPISPKVSTFNSSKEGSGIPHGDLALELDKFKQKSEEGSFKRDSYSDTYSACTASLRTPTSPMSNKDKNGIVKSPDKTFSPFPTRSSMRQPKEISLRLGLYKDSIKSPTK